MYPGKTHNMKEVWAPEKILAIDLNENTIPQTFNQYISSTVEVVNDQNLFTESNLADWFSSYVQFCSGGHFSERAEAAR